MIDELRSFSRQVSETCLNLKTLLLQHAHAILDGGLDVADNLCRGLSHLRRQSHNAGGFLPAVKQIGNVAALPGTLVTYYHTFIS